MTLVLAFCGDPEDDPHPRCEDFPDHTAYVQAFHIWRARRRENRLNPEEMAAQWSVVEHAILNRDHAKGQR